MIIRRKSGKLYQQDERSPTGAWIEIDQSQLSYELALGFPSPEIRSQYHREDEDALRADFEASGLDDIFAEFPTPRRAAVRERWGNQGAAIRAHEDYEEALADSAGQ